MEPERPNDRVGREHALRTAVLAGDERTWRSWYDAAYDRLRAYVRWRCGGLDDLADDVVQETWLTAVRRIRSFDPEQGTFLQWLRGIAGNVLRNRLREGGRQPSRNGQPIERVAAAEGETKANAEQVARTLAALPERYEAVLRAKYLEQQTVAEIAAEHHESTKAIESLLTRARQAFREAYAALESSS